VKHGVNDDYLAVIMIALNGCRHEVAFLRC